MANFCDIDDEEAAFITRILMEDQTIEARNEGVWQTVTYKKRRSRKPENDGSVDSGSSVRFSEENRSEVSGGDAAELKNSIGRRKKKKAVKGSTVAAEITAIYLEAELAEIEGLCKREHDKQLKRLVELFGRIFSDIDASQFPWLKSLRDPKLAKMTDFPLSNIPKDVCEVASKWIAQRNPKALGSFVLWSLDDIFSPKTESEKSKVATFTVLAMVLRRRPDVLVALLPTFSENPKYHQQDNLPVTIWMIAQASQTDALVGLRAWVHILLPILDSKSSFDSLLSMDMILQLAERILFSTARHVLPRKGESLVPPSALATLMRLAFPRSSAKETERLRAIYLALKDISLAGYLENKGMKQITEQMLSHAVKAPGEGIGDLSKEATDIFIWCLVQNPDCFRQWDKLYLDNLKASVVVLRKLAAELTKFPAADKLWRQTLRNFTQKNRKALEKPENPTNLVGLLKDSEKCCKEILGESGQSEGCRFMMKSIVMVSAALGLGFAATSYDKLHWMF